MSMPAASGCTTSKLRFSLWIHASSPAVACDSSGANGPALDGRLLSWFPPVVWVSCEPFHVEFNLARPGRRNYPISPAGSGLFLFQDNAATIFTIANTGAMLMFGQERSREYA